MVVNNLRIGWLGTLAVAGCVFFSSAGRAVGDEMPSAGWWLTQPVMGQPVPTSVFGLADQAQTPLQFALGNVDHVLDTSTMSRLREINAQSSFSVLG